MELEFSSFFLSWKGCLSQNRDKARPIRKARDARSRATIYMKSLLWSVFHINHPFYEDGLKEQVKKNSTGKVTFVLGLQMNRICLILVFLQPKETRGGIWIWAALIGKNTDCGSNGVRGGWTSREELWLPYKLLDFVQWAGKGEKSYNLQCFHTSYCPTDHNTQTRV